ncbi:hypothetical protein [Arenimonas daejeonensis]|uniref:hypothetical protein n=1 Tax=Arenimonas daejeonensis TaxID=370777 RepID=UPI0013157CA5|nr:hypothetical protein [Arenimonas daejeonensis]
MHRIRMTWIAALLLALLLPATQAVADTLPHGTLQAGSLANGKLVQDTMAAVMPYVDAKGCPVSSG